MTGAPYDNNCDGSILQPATERTRALSSRSPSNAVDLSRYGDRGCSRAFHPNDRAGDRPLSGWDDEYPNCDRPDRDDVSPLREGEVRGAWACLPRYACSGLIIAAKLADRPAAHVWAGRTVPPRLSAVYGGAHPDRPGTLYRYGHCLER